MDTKLITVETPHPPISLITKLKEITVNDFDELKKNTNALYYGEVETYSFCIKHLRYGPMSAIPSIEGDIKEGVNGSVINIRFDINDVFQSSKKMYLSTLIPLSGIFILLSILLHGGTEYQWESLIASISFLILSIGIVWVSKISLVSAKKREIREFLSKVNGKIIEQIYH